MITVNQDQILKVAETLRQMPVEEHTINFYSFNIAGQDVIQNDMYPSLNHPQAVNFFFFAIMHDFGFWYGDAMGYVEPLYGKFRGKREKGSELMWKVLLRQLYESGHSFEPEVLANIEPKKLAHYFSDDNGPIPWPDFETRLSMTREYGRWFLRKKASPGALVELANERSASLKSFIEYTTFINGYDQDKFKKRNYLLAMVLANRPEHFLKVNDSENWNPIVDYHLMRVALRLGLIQSEVNLSVLEERSWCDHVVESEVRQATFGAMQQLIKESGKNMSFVDFVMWSARKYCPEMTEPDCSRCIFNDVCAKRTKLFQPVIRTTAY